MTESVKIDLRLDPGLKEKLEAIAVEYFEARIHHISKRPELTTTINRLIKLGIKALEDGCQDKSASYPDNAITSETMNQAIAAALAPISDDLENVKKQVSGLLSGPPPYPLEVNQAIAALRSQVDRLEGAIEPYPGVIGKLKSEINSLKGSEPSESTVEPMESLELVETVETMEAVEAIAQVPEQTEPTIEPMETDFSQGLTGKELAKRLKVSPSGLSRAWKPDPDSDPRPEHFREWSKEKDRENIAWEKKGDKFFPVSD